MEKNLLSVRSVKAAFVLQRQEVQIGLRGVLGVAQKPEYKLKPKGGLFKTL